MTSTRTLSLLVQLVFVHHTAGSPVSVFRPTGGSVTLEFQGHQQLEKEDVDLIQWYFGLEKIMKYAPPRDTVTVFTHQDRVEFNNKTFSLELKNLQKNDSGLYRGEISAVETEVKVEYKLSVLEPVSAPVLMVLSTRSTSDPCNVTLTCRGHDLSLNISCSNDTCWQEGGGPSDSSLTLFVTEGTIICNHSNEVSSRTDTREIKTLCGRMHSLSKIRPIFAIVRLLITLHLIFPSDQRVTLPKNSAGVYLSIAVACTVTAVTVVVIAVFLRRRLKAGGADIHTEYASITNTPALQSSAPTIYSTVQLPSPSASDVESPYAESVANPIYSMVQRPQTSSTDPLTSYPTSLYATVK